MKIEELKSLLRNLNIPLILVAKDQINTWTLELPNDISIDIKTDLDVICYPADFRKVLVDKFHIKKTFNDVFEIYKGVGLNNDWFYMVTVTNPLKKFSLSTGINDPVLIKDIEDVLEGKLYYLAVLLKLPDCLTGILK